MKYNAFKLTDLIHFPLALKFMLCSILVKVYAVAKLGISRDTYERMKNLWRASDRNDPSWWVLPEATISSLIRDPQMGASLWLSGWFCRLRYGAAIWYVQFFRVTYWPCNSRATRSVWQSTASTFLANDHILPSSMYHCRLIFVTLPQLPVWDVCRCYGITPVGLASGQVFGTKAN